MNHPPTEKAINPWSIWVPIIIMVLGVVILYNYSVIQSLRKDKSRPPFVTQLKDDLTLVERSGKEVKLSELRGKVILGAHFYSTCPSGCSVLIEELKKVYDEYAAKEPKLHFISFAIDPADTPERMKEAAEGHDITGDNWWFVNGDQTKLRAYLNLKMKFFKLEEKPADKQTSPVDKYNHDMRVVLIDAEGHVRGMYEVMNPDPEFRQIHLRRLRQDLEYVLREKPGQQPSH